MDFKKFENDVPINIPPTNGEPFMLVKSKPTDISPTLKKRFLILGIIQIINGLLLMVINIIGIFVGAAITMYAGPGIWVGIFVVVGGIFGVLIRSKTSRGYVITFMTLSIISSVFIWCVIGMTIPAIMLDSHYYYYSVNGVAINSVLLIIGLVEMVVAIVASAFGCGVMCCNSEPTKYIPVRMDMHTHNLVFESTPPPAYAKDQQY